MDWTPDWTPDREVEAWPGSLCCVLWEGPGLPSVWDKNQETCTSPVSARDARASLLTQGLDLVLDTYM